MADPFASGNALNAFYSLAPRNADIADMLGAPIDAATYLLKRMGINVPTEYVPSSYNPDTDPIYGLQKAMGIAAGKPPPATGYTRRPTAEVPFSSAFFENALNNPPNWPAFYNALRAVKPFP